VPKDIPSPEQHLEMASRILGGPLGPRLWESSGQDPQRFGQLVTQAAYQVLSQHLGWVRESSQTGDIIPLVCSILDVDNPYVKAGKAYDLARIRIQPHVGKLQREQNIWVDLREPSGQGLAQLASQLVGHRCRIYQHVRMVLGPDGEPVLTEEGRPRQHHYAVRIETLDDGHAAARPAPAPVAPAPVAPAPVAPAAHQSPPPKPAKPDPQETPPPPDGYSSWDQAREARAKVNAMLAQLRSVSEELYQKGREHIGQMGLGWPQPPDRIELVLRLLDQLRQEYLEPDRGAAVPLVAPGAALDETEPEDLEELPYEQDPDQGGNEHLAPAQDSEEEDDQFWP